MKYWLIPAVLSAFLLLSCASQQNKETADIHLKIGVSQLEKNNTPGALKSLLKSEQLNPDEPLVHNYLGLTYFAIQKYADAISQFKKAISLDEKFTEARNNLGRTYIEVGQYKAARAELQKVLLDLTYGDPSRALSNIGLAYFMEHNYKQALPYFQKSIVANKNNCIAYNYYGRSLYELKEFQSALPVFDSAVPLCQKIQYDEAHYFAAMSYYKSGDKPKGIALMNETILNYPNGKYQERAKNMLELMKYNKM